MFFLVCFEFKNVFSYLVIRMFSVVTILTFLIRYLEGALVSDSDSPLDSAKTPTGRRRDYAPSTEPGSRLPHMSIRLLSDLSNEVFHVKFILDS